MTARLQMKALVEHAGRVALGLGLLVAGRHHAVLALIGALALHLAAFAFTHDLVHGALGLPRRLNELAISVTSLPMLVAGHGMRLLHLRHHAHPLEEHDVEGVGATLPMWRALVGGPLNAAQYRIEAFRAASRTDQGWLIGETLAAVALTTLALLSRSVIGAAWVLVNVAMQLTAAVWASHLTHRPPRIFLAIARTLEWTHSAVISSFLHHEKHHRFPAIPCGQLRLQ